MPGQSRKRMKSYLFLQYIKKQRGGRNINATFKTVCSPEGASAKLLGLRSIKTPEESDNFVHVVKSQYRNDELVVKVQEPGHMLSMELKIHNVLKDCNNVIRYLCDFECLFDNLIWNKQITVPRYFCDNKGEKMHVIIMEYINTDVAEFLEYEKYNKPVLKSIVKQAGLALLYFHLECGICHNDINRGNILLKKNTIPSTLKYSIQGYTTDVDTLGHEVIYIDFQRGNMLGIEGDDCDLSFQLAKDEISLLYELMSKWANQNKLELKILMTNIMNSESIKELIDHICNF